MAARDSIFKLLNLDGLDSAGKPKKKKSASTTATKGQTSAGASPWVSAGEAVERTRAADELPWQIERSTGRAWYWRLLRTLLIAAAIIVILVGLRTMFIPPESTDQAAAVDPVAQFPAADASGVAERFTESYLTWDAANPGERSAALALDVPSVGNDDKFGWDGTGVQAATGARTLSVDATSDTEATVTVVAHITTQLPEGEPTSRWTALAVPVAVSGARVVVIGQPASVAVPDAIGYEADARPNEDTKTARATEEYAESFFIAYGRDADVSPVTAPGSGITGLDGIYEFSTLKSWTVYEGKGDNRSARAVVQWIDAAGSTIEQTYSLTLTKVSGGASTRWQIASIDGSN